MKLSCVAHRNSAVFGKWRRRYQIAGASASRGIAEQFQVIREAAPGGLWRVRSGRNRHDERRVDVVKEGNISVGKLGATPVAVAKDSISRGAKRRVEVIDKGDRLGRRKEVRSDACAWHRRIGDALVDDEALKLKGKGALRDKLEAKVGERKARQGIALLVERYVCETRTKLVGQCRARGQSQRQ